MPRFLGRLKALAMLATASLAVLNVIAPTEALAQQHQSFLRIGEAEAGFLTLGEPQAELKLDLPPTRLVEPKPGRLVLFPSWMWHGTRPFGAGERMTVAFDVAIPPSIA